jgi:hypothetical protein
MGISTSTWHRQVSQPHSAQESGLHLVIHRIDRFGALALAIDGYAQGALAARHRRSDGNLAQQWLRASIESVAHAL